MRGFSQQATLWKDKLNLFYFHFPLKFIAIVMQLYRSDEGRTSRVSFRLNFLSPSCKKTWTQFMPKWLWQLRNYSLYQNTVLTIALDFLVAWTCSLLGGQFVGELSRTVERLGMHDRIALGGTSPRRRRYLFNLSAVLILRNIFKYALKKCFTVADRSICCGLFRQHIWGSTNYLDFNFIHF